MILHLMRARPSLPWRQTDPSESIIQQQFPDRTCPSWNRHNGEIFLASSLPGEKYLKYALKSVIILIKTCCFCYQLNISLMISLTLMLMFPPVFSCSHKVLNIQYQLIIWIIAIGGTCFSSQEIIICHHLPLAPMALFMLSSRSQKVPIIFP